MEPHMQAANARLDRIDKLEAPASDDAAEADGSPPQADDHPVAEPQAAAPIVNQEHHSGELFKLERAMFTGQTEYHRRHFVLLANELQYFRLLHTVTGEWTMGQQAQSFLLSEIDTVSLSQPAEPAAASGDDTIDATFEDPGALGLTVEWPSGVVTAIEPGSPASQVEGLVPGHTIASVNGTETLELSQSKATSLYHSAPRPTRLVFKPAADRLRFELTMNRNYRKPGRVYRMQAPTRAAAVAWVEAVRDAKASFEQLGPWQMRGLSADRSADEVAECMISRTRSVAATSMFGRGYTVFVIEARTRGGVSFQCEKRFSDFRGFHAEWLEPVMSLGSPLPIPSANPVDKNADETVEARKVGLTNYLREAVALCQRLGSAPVTAALQRFLRDSDEKASTPREDSDLVPRSELWRQVQGCVWDVAGTWAFRESVPFHGSVFTLHHRLTLSVDGSAVLEASGHPEYGGYARAVGKWENADAGRKVSMSFTEVQSATGKVSMVAHTREVALTVDLSKSHSAPTDEQIDGISWKTRSYDRRRRLSRTNGPIELAPGYMLPVDFGSRDESLAEGGEDDSSDADDEDNGSSTAQSEPAVIRVTLDGTGPLGLQFARDSNPPLAITNIAPGSIAAKRPELHAGMILETVASESLAGLTFDAVLDLLRHAPRPVKLTFTPGQRPASDAQSDDGPVHKEGELLKLEAGMVSQYFGRATVEYHRRHFVLRPNQLEYYRMLTLDTAGTKRLFLLSEIDSIALVDTDDAASSEAEVDVEGTFAPSSSLSTFEALGLTLKWPIVEELSDQSPMKTTEPIQRGAIVSCINGTSCEGMTEDQVTKLYQTEVLTCLNDSPQRQVSILFKPAADRLRFELTMNRNYRKPGRVYRMQAPTRAAAVAWVEAVRDAKASFEQLGPWQMRGLSADRSADEVAECMISRTRSVAATSMFGRGYTVFVIEARTRGGVSFQCEKRFSDFRGFHAEWLEPVMSLGSPLPIPSANPVDKNADETVEARKVGLTNYLREAVALCQRLGSAPVTAALQRFLRDSDEKASTPREDSDLVPRSELWRQVQGCVWDVAGTWAFNEAVDDETVLRHRLTLGTDGGAIFDATGAADGNTIRASGTWETCDSGRAIDVKLAFPDPTAGAAATDVHISLRKEVRGPTDTRPTNGIQWDTRVESLRRLLVRTQGSIGSNLLLEGQAGHAHALSKYCIPAMLGSTSAVLSNDGALRPKE